jgi:hypothetical protein
MIFSLGQLWLLLGGCCGREVCLSHQLEEFRGFLEGKGGRMLSWTISPTEDQWFMPLFYGSSNPTR